MVASLPRSMPGLPHLLSHCRLFRGYLLLPIHLILILGRLSVLLSCEVCARPISTSSSVLAVVV